MIRISWSFCRLLNIDKKWWCSMGLLIHFWYWKQWLLLSYLYTSIPIRPWLSLSASHRFASRPPSPLRHYVLCIWVHSIHLFFHCSIHLSIIFCLWDWAPLVFNAVRTLKETKGCDNTIACFVAWPSKKIKVCVVSSVGSMICSKWINVWKKVCSRNNLIWSVRIQAYCSISSSNICHRCNCPCPRDSPL